MRRRRELSLDRTGLNKAFALMRKRGLIARQNFSCCGGCAGYEIAQDVEKMAATAVGSSTDVAAPNGPDKQIAGTVFYHRQTNDRLRTTGRGHLYFGPVEVSAVGVVGRPAEDVGVLVTAALAQAGVPFRWDGDGQSAIEFWLAEK